MSDVIRARKFEQNGFTVVVEHVYDTDSECETPEQQQENYKGLPAKEKAKYFKQDQKRYDAWTKGEWFYMGVAARILKQTATNWADGGLEVGRSSVWCIESDSDESYIATTEREEIASAFAEVDRLKQALCGQ